MLIRILAAAATLALVVANGPATAAVTVQVSKGVGTALSNAGKDADAERKEIEKRFNDGLKELGKTNAAAKALYDSNQTIRIVCYGDPEAGNRTPADGVFAEPVETLGDFDAAGNPRTDGTAIIIIDCGLLQGRQGFFHDPEGFIGPLFTPLTHELLHATHRDRVHGGPGTDSLDLYREWEEKFAEALERVKTAQRPGRKRTRTASLKGGKAVPEKRQRLRVAVQQEKKCVGTTTELAGVPEVPAGGVPQGTPVVEIGQGTRSNPDSAGPPPPLPNMPEHTDGNDQQMATPGADEFTGGKGRDEFIFRTDSFFPDSPQNTLDDGDRIRDYESGEPIIIEGDLLSGRQISLDYDEEKDETRLGIDLDKDGQPDRTIILDGDKRGQVRTSGNCCGVRTSEIYIDLPQQQAEQQGGQQNGKSGTGQPPRKDGTPKEAGVTPPDAGSGKSSAPTKKADGGKATEQPTESKQQQQSSSGEQTSAGDEDLGLVKAKRTVLLRVVNKGTGKPVENSMVKFLADEPPLPSVAESWPPVGAGSDFAADVSGGASGKDGTANLDLPDYAYAIPIAATYDIPVETEPKERIIVGLQGKPETRETNRSYSTLPDHILEGYGKPLSPKLEEQIQEYFAASLPIGSRTALVLEVPGKNAAMLKEALAKHPGIAYFEPDPCFEKEQADDPYFSGKGAWGQDFDDQWAVKRAGFTGDGEGALAALGDKPAEVTVAVIDTGIDWLHPDLPPASLWRNSDEIPGNGVDDDGNGYVDDVIGWDFVENDNKPWDHDGHGTFVAGVIAAARGNGAGIAGLNPHARIMVLRALDAFGRGYTSMSAAAIAYAVDNGARVINLSLGGRGLTKTAQLAVDYAREKGAVVVVAAGNDGAEVKDYAPAGLEGVITVSATDRADRRAGFSNYGPGVDIAAPGVDVLSLRARNTDLLAFIRGVDYEIGKGIVGDDRAYYRASGTSFAAPIVSGTASALLSMNPDLTGEEVVRMMLNSSRDIDTPGIDNFSGYGLVDAIAALKADPAYFVNSRISGVKVVKGTKGPALQVLGTADADRFADAVLELGKGEDPKEWKAAAPKLAKPVEAGVVAEIPASSFRGAKQWTIRLITTHKDGSTRESRFSVTLG